jgi:hypothetical protein
MRGLFVMNVNFTFFLWSGLGSIITGKLFIQKPHYYCFRRVQSSSKTFIIMLWDWLRKLRGFWHNFAKWQSSKKEHFVGERHIFSFVGFLHVNLQNG